MAAERSSERSRSAAEDLRGKSASRRIRCHVPGRGTSIQNDITTNPLGLGLDTAAL